jgi:flagellar hook-associated protein 1 FlgK
MSSPGTFFGLEIALRGLQAHQKSLEVTGHNIANANTPGYSRQEAVHKSGIPYPAPGANSGTAPGQLGSGVEINEVRRIRNEYLDTQVRDSTSSESFWSSRAEIMEQIESIFPEPDGRGIQEVLLNFFSDWQDLNNTPQDTGIMAAVVESGKELARLFRDTHGQLQNVGKSILNDIAPGTNQIKGGRLFDQVTKVKDLAKQITNLNESIVRVKAEGRQPNDLLDKRDLLLNELAEFGPIKVTGTGDGAVKVSMFNGALSLVEPGQEITNLEVIATGSDIITLKSTMNGINEKTINLTDGNVLEISKGSLLGAVSAWQQNNTFIDKLNQLSRSLGDVVNMVYNPDPKIGPPNFWQFKDSNGNSVHGSARNAGQIYVNSTLIEDSSQLDGTEALDVARLRNETFVSVWSTDSTGNELTGIDDKVKEDILEAKIGIYFNNLVSPATVTVEQNSQSFDITFDPSNVSYAELITEINNGAQENGMDLIAGLKQDGDGNWEFFVSSTKPGREYEIEIIGLSGDNFFNSDNAFDTGDGHTIESFYQGYISTVGSQTKSSQDMQSNQQAILEQITSLQESVSGVSLDEELSRTIQFQYGYQASARVMNVMDSILDTLINRMAV